jgi:hypothetical protein
MEYTKGEWERITGGNWIGVRNPENAEIIAQCWQDGYITSKIEAKANAHLIAAAPDMYLALKEYQYYNRCHNDAEAKLFDIAMKALAKAEGKGE